jgi:HD-GYP domain-containing protein (c-di-GMP phosphodiesterase class II)
MYRQKIFEYKSMRSSILSSIKRTMFEKSDETEEHAERMAELVKSFGEALNLSAEDIVALTLLSTLHDIGKISIDKNLLTKTEPLSDEEWREIKKHPEIGFRIAQSSPELVHIAEYILSHHERWDGKGYPKVSKKGKYRYSPVLFLW